MPNETRVAKHIEELQQQIRQNQAEIDQLKQKIKELQNQWGSLKNDELDTQLNKGEELEFGTLGAGVIKGKINWMNLHLISLTTSDEDPPTEILVFKRAITYIRKSEEKSISRRGMYI